MADIWESKELSYRMGFHMTNTLPQDQGLNIFCSSLKNKDTENKITITIHNDECNKIEDETGTIGTEHCQHILTLDVDESQIPRFSSYLKQVLKMLEDNYDLKK